MALDITKLKRTGPQNSDAPVIWTYTTADTLATADGSGYFNSAADRLQVGDRRLLHARAGRALHGLAGASGRQQADDDHGNPEPDPVHAFSLVRRARSASCSASVNATLSLR